MMFMTAIAIFLAAPAFAEGVSCHFTEPFIKIHLETELGVGIYEGSEPEDMWIYGKLTTIGTGNGIFTIDLSQYHRGVLTIDTNRKGSDGMSDLLYPYEGKLDTGRGDAPLIGGCSSKSNRAVCPVDSGC